MLCHFLENSIKYKNWKDFDDTSSLQSEVNSNFASN